MKSNYIKGSYISVCGLFCYSLDYLKIQIIDIVKKQNPPPPLFSTNFSPFHFFGTMGVMRKSVMKIIGEGRGCCENFLSDVAICKKKIEKWNENEKMRGGGLYVWL